MFCQCTSVGRIRHSSDPLDLSRLGQLHRPYGPADRTREDHLSTSTGRHAPFHHLGGQHNQQGESGRLKAPAAEFLTLIFSGGCHFTLSSSPSPSMPNFLISGTAVVFSTSTFRRRDNAVQCRNKLKPPELDESHRLEFSRFPYRGITGVIGDAPQRGLQRALHERGQHEQGLQVVADGALRVAVVLDWSAGQQAGLVKQRGALKDTTGETESSLNEDLSLSK